MLKRLLSRITPSFSTAPAPVPREAVAAALQRAIDDKRKTDPLIGAKLGGKEVCQRVMATMRGDKGIHIDSVLCALGALAGYACQASLRAQARAQGLPETAALVVATARDGKQYFFGDPLNRLLAEAPLSVWSLAAGTAQLLGCQTLPEVVPIFARVTQTVGGDAFGRPEWPAGHRPGDLPLNYLTCLWPSLLPVAERFCAVPAEWPLMFGCAIQEAMDMGKSVIAPDLALRIVMESAVPMSKVDLAAA